MSKRDDIKADVASALRAHPTGLTYHDLAVITGLSHAAVGKGVKWLGEDGVVIGLPAPKNGYRATLDDVVTAKVGEANQGRHLATRLESMASRLEAHAAASSGPYQAYVRSAARHLTTTAADVRDLVSVMEP